jgi:hypothetical protein
MQQPGFNNLTITASSDLSNHTIKNSMILNLDVYESGVRDIAVKFCGWHRCTMPRPEETANHRGTMAQISQFNLRLYEAVKKAELGVRGGTMRAVVMAALHFDFGQAQSMGSLSETVTPYNEDQTNMQNLINLLAQLKQLSDE